MIALINITQRLRLSTGRCRQYCSRLWLGNKKLILWCKLRSSAEFIAFSLLYLTDVLLRCCTLWYVYSVGNFWVHVWTSNYSIHKVSIFVAKVQLFFTYGLTWTYIVLWLFSSIGYCLLWKFLGNYWNTNTKIKPWS